jgi:hypothetical protein
VPDKKHSAKSPTLGKDPDFGSDGTVFLKKPPLEISLALEI